MRAERRTELFPIGRDADPALGQSPSHFFGGLRFNEYGCDLRMRLAETAFEFNNCRLDLGRVKGIVELDAEADDNLIWRELDGGDPVRLADALDATGRREDRLPEFRVGALADE